MRLAPFLAKQGADDEAFDLADTLTDLGALITTLADVATVLTDQGHTRATRSIADDLRSRPGTTELLVAHNGSGLRLADIPRLGLPWVSGKSLDSGSTGRFGIGLTTLRMLSTSWEVHGHPYHVRFADVTLAPADPPHLPADISGREWTVFRIPLDPGVLSAEELLAWFENWQDSSLLFLRDLEQVTVATDGTPLGPPLLRQGAPARLAERWSEPHGIPPPAGRDGHPPAVLAPAGEDVQAVPRHAGGAAPRRAAGS
ncbi:hypothetical protein ACH4E7_25185 [Kitasatospora sp. NPDC018058]|uniref:hypothetical protein n=1 Tax=Kitasatospora sp. NPDC018058 TaxID=3364025 RepID=UPI0037BE62DD